MLTGLRPFPNCGRSRFRVVVESGWLGYQSSWHLRPNLILLLACRGSLSSWLPLRVRLRRFVVRLRRCRRSLVVLVTFLRSRETRVTCGLRPVSPPNLTPVSLKTWSSASSSSSSLSSSPCARACPRPRPCARETSVMYGLGLAFALKPLVPGCRGSVSSASSGPSSSSSCT